MKFKEIEIRNSDLQEFHSTLKGLPPLKESDKTTYALGRTLKKLRDPIETLQESNQALFKECFGEAAEVTPKHENWSSFQKRSREINRQMVKVEYMEFDLSDYKQSKNELSAAQMEWLLFMVKDPDQEAPKSE